MFDMDFDSDSLNILVHLGTAWLAGSLIGLERSFHARPAGFRTHALVCLASALLMLVTTYQAKWTGTMPLDSVTTDPTRMAQGIMTGIGFLGAGVIFKEGLTVRGLTTAASIWMTAALGILFGVGFFFPAVLGTVATLGTLALFRWLERFIPTEFYAHLALRFPGAKTPSEAEVRGLLAGHGFSIANMSYRQDEGGKHFEYRMVIKSSRRANATRLAEALRTRKDVMEFRISPSGD